MAQDKELFGLESELPDGFDEALVDAILSAYPSAGREFLYLRLRNKWGVVVSDDITALDQGGRIIVDRIVQFAKSGGRRLDLLALLWTDKSGNPKLKQLADKWLPDQGGVVAKYVQPLGGPPTGAAARPALEKLVSSRSRLLDMGAFLSGMQRLSGALCRIGTPRVQGSGFLIGRQTVLTNFHVVETAVEESFAGDQIVCEFDYAGDNSTPVTYLGADGLTWLIDQSKYSESDRTGVGDPAPGELDFAVIRLAKPVEPSRKALPWPETAPIVSPGDFVLVGQHPQGDARKVAFGEVVEYPGSGLRYRYDVTTLPGSSGSPVLDLDLNLVALHHAADPRNNPTYNQGVPIARVKAALIAAKHDLATF